MSSNKAQSTGAILEYARRLFPDMELENWAVREFRNPESEVYCPHLLLWDKTQGTCVISIPKLPEPYPRTLAGNEEKLRQLAATARLLGLI